MIFVALVVSDTGCTSALTFYFADNSMPERKAIHIGVLLRRPSALCPEERRRLQRASFGNQWLQYWRQPLRNREHQDLLTAGNEIRLDLGTQRAAYGSSTHVSSVVSNNVFQVVVRTEASDSATDAPKDYATSTALSPHAFCKCWRLLGLAKRVW
ncbi:hypothetical protein MTO96_003993 [Rhipicephalus appendiculatus]